MDIKVMLAALGLPEGATAEQVTDFAVKAEATKLAHGRLLSALGLALGASDADISGKLEQLNAPAGTVSKLLGALKVQSADEALGTIAALQANAEQTDGDGYVKVMAALGAKSPDEAIGTIEAFKAAKERLAEAEAKLADLTQQREQAERDSIIAKLEADGKCTPAQKKDLLPSLSTEALHAFAATAPAMLKGDGARPPGSGPSHSGNASGSAPTWKSKTYADLSNKERLALADEDQELFNSMRDHALQNRLI